VAKQSTAEFDVSADNIDEAAQFAVEHLQQLAIAQGARGFDAPTLVRESFQLIDGSWKHVYRFGATMIEAT
jgi:hypothetical protein